MMSRRAPVDWINWRLYRRAWVVSALAVCVLVVTSFQPQTPPPAQLPPTLSGVQGAGIARDAKAFDAAWRDRRPGRSDSLDSAQAIRSQLREAGTNAKVLSRTTIDPATRKSVPLTTVEGVLRGRTAEAVIITAPRDNSGPTSTDGAAGSTLALVALAEELAATRDRRRTYVFMSTDGSTINASGLANLRERAKALGIKPFAVISLHRIGASRNLRVGWAPSGRYSPPVGLGVAAMDAVQAEGGMGAPPSPFAQVLRLAMPLTLFEHSAPLADGLPAVSITASEERTRPDGRPDTNAAALTSGIRATQRLLGTLDGVDTLQTAGKTSVASRDRIWRGWAIKLLLAALLIPFQAAVADFVARHRRQWSLLPALGSTLRALLAAMWAVCTAWLFAAVGWFPGTDAGPIHPDRLANQPVIAVAAWLLLVWIGWLVARAPDRRHANVAGHDRGVLVVALPTAGVLAILMLAVNPYSVLFTLPALHAWMLLASRRVHDRSTALVIWAGGLIGPLALIATIAATFGTGIGSPWYLIDAVATRSIPPMLGMLGAGGVALGALILVGIRGHVTRPLLPQLLRGEVDPLGSAVGCLARAREKVNGQVTARHTRSDRQSTRRRVNSR